MGSASPHRRTLPAMNGGGGAVLSYGATAPVSHGSWCAVVGADRLATDTLARALTTYGIPAATVADGSASAGRLDDHVTVVVVCDDPSGSAPRDSAPNARRGRPALLVGGEPTHR